MLLKKEGLPEEGELVLCTVTNVQYHSVFVLLDEYGKNAMIHISEVAPGRIRNIRDFVVEGKKVVCKVLRVNPEKDYIDLSLRRVNEGEKRRKIEEIKLEQLAEKIVEMVAKQLKVPFEPLYQNLKKQILKKYPLLHVYFQEVARQKGDLDDLELSKEAKTLLLEAVQQRFKPLEIEIVGELKLSSYAPDGIGVVKEALIKAEEKGEGKMDIKYRGGGKYKVTVKALDYKEAEKLVKNSVDTALKILKEGQGTGEFMRIEKK